MTTTARTAAIHFIRAGEPISARGRTQISAAFGLIEFVAAAAVLEHGWRELLECRLIRNSGLGSLDVLDELGEAGVEAPLFPPDRGRPPRSAASLAVVRKQRCGLRRAFVERLQGVLHRRQIERDL